MPDTAARLLALLSLLQSRPDWSGTELAERLGVTTRTIRNDIDRLRELDYPVDATRGAAGGYRLGAGGKLPPLLLDDEEAVAVAIGLRAATGIAGIEESARAPSRSSSRCCRRACARRSSAIATVVDRGAREHRHGRPRPRGRPRRARRDRGRHPRRRVAPLRLPRRRPARRAVPAARAGSAAGTSSAATRDRRVGTFRADWIEPRADPPPLLPALRCPAATTPPSRCARSRRAAGSARPAHRAALRPTRCSRASTRPSASSRRSTPTTCVLVTGADSLDTIAAYIGMLGLEFRVTEPPELVEHLAELAGRYRRSVEVA